MTPHAEMDRRFQKDWGQVKRQGPDTPAICNLQSENQSALARLAKAEGTGSGGSKCKHTEDKKVHEGGWKKT